MLKTLGLFFLTALMEILGCFLPYLWLRQQGSVGLLLLGSACLVAFVYLLSLHPTASGRVYAAYGGVYVISALIWLCWVDKVALQWQDWVGAGVILAGVILIVSPWSR